MSDKDKNDNKGNGSIALFPGVKKDSEGNFTRNDTVKDERLNVSDSINRLGRFYVNEPVFNCVTMASILAAIRFVPCNVSFDYTRRLFLYEGYSPGFDVKTNIYSPNPEYFLTVTGGEAGADFVVNVQRKPMK